MTESIEVYTIDADVYIPGTLVAGTGCTVSGTTVTKTGGVDGAWDVQCTSSAPLVGNAQCSFSSGQMNQDVQAGFSLTPMASAHYNTMNYAIFFYTDGNQYIYEDGTYIGVGGDVFTTSDIFEINYNGSTVKYYKNGVEIRSVAASAGLSLSFDSSFYSAGASLTNVIVGSVDTKRFATHGIYYNNNYYEPRIKNPWNFQQTLFLKDSTSGDSTSGFGVVELINTDGGLDAFVNYGMDGRPIVLRKIIAGVATLLMSCSMEQPTTTWDTVSLRVKDKQMLLNVPCQPTKYGGTNVLPDGGEGADDIKGKPKPLLFGDLSRPNGTGNGNCTPYCVNTSRLIYQGHESALQDITAVYDKGVSLTRGTNYSSAADMQANQPAPGEYRAYLAGGMFRLGSSPAGQITFDAIEGATAADRTAAQVAKRIALRALPSAEISAADVTALDTANSAVVGIYINSETTIQAALNEVLDSVGAAFTFDSAGVLRMTRIVAPSGSPVAEYGTAEIRAIERKPTNDEGRGVPPYKINLGYGKNNTVQNAGQLAGSLSRSDWGATSLPSTASWFRTVFGNGAFVAIAKNSNKSCRSIDGVNWVEHALPANVNWYSITYGNGLFVAIAYNTDIYATSPDGITWTQRTLPVSTGWMASYGNGVFVVITNYTTSLTSTDGINWTSRTIPVSGNWQLITYNKGLFVAIAQGGAIAVTSPDGVTWTQRTLPATATWSSITYGNGFFVTVASGTNTYATSPDGITWTQRTLPTAGGAVSVKYGDGVFITLAYNSTVSLMSADGINWDSVSLPTTNYYALEYGNGMFVALGYDLATGAMYRTLAAAERIEYLSKEFRTVTAVDTTILQKHPTAREINKNTLIVSKTAAQTEADRLLALKKVDRDYLSIKVDNSLVPVDVIGKVIILKIPRYEYDAGKLFIVLGTVTDYSLKTTELLIWG